MRLSNPWRLYLRAATACAGGWLWIAALTAPDALHVHAQASQPAGADWTAHWHREAGAPPGTAYAGSRACAECHAAIVNTQATTGMAHAAADAQSAPTDAKGRALSYHDGSWNVRIERKDHQLMASATDGSSTLAFPVRWTFGLGNAGQTYILEHDGHYYESRVSYYNALDNLDLTIGHARETPSSLAAALGRPLSADELKQCFSCHTSEDVFAGELRISDLHPGVSCENCHGPGSDHVRAMELTSGASAAPIAIVNPGKFTPADVNDFCGTCHRSTRDVLRMNVRDVRNVRFQPYRLENSRCYDPTDKRITCIACHDPHRNLATDAASYDARCLACHAQQGGPARAAAACPRATRDCVTCHMPKIALPGAHFAFTDHYIRVVRRGERYPG